MSEPLSRLLYEYVVYLVHLLFIDKMASKRIKQETLDDVVPKRINYVVPPGKDPLNVQILMDMSKKVGYWNDYMEIVKTFDRYRYTPVVRDNWRGFAVSTAELVRALTIGNAQTVKKRENGSQTEEDAFETQWMGGDPVNHNVAGSGGSGDSAVWRGSPDMFSDDFQNY